MATSGGGHCYSEYGLQCNQEINIAAGEEQGGNGMIVDVHPLT